jgi:uncharacterized protein
MMARVGLISDTHGILRPEALRFLGGCEAIVHAGDFGVASILDELAALAPVTAVRGNIDRDAWADALPHTALVRIADVCIHVIHDLAQLDIDLQAAGVQVVVSGHSHKPVIARRHGVLFVNPGSAGPRRFTLPITIGELIISGADVSARIVDLETGRVIPT